MPTASKGTAGADVARARGHDESIGDCGGEGTSFRKARA